ncbi:hypothetical protein V5S96_06400 [Corynebacterium mastitidis]|uniref:Uncharacterized protein n=1 Tax=Corynebacterium mastitidis TaxID=161890 RepID=A0ABU8NY87_9CORY
MKKQTGRMPLRGATLLAAGAILVLGTPYAHAETPEERCARETAAHNATMEALWRASHPGQEPGPGAWPPYVCVGGPGGNDDGGQQNVTPPAAGQQGTSGATGQEDSGPLYGREHRWDDGASQGHQRTHRWDDEASGHERTHRWDDSGRAPSQYEEDMRLGPLGESRRGASQPGNSRVEGPSAGDSARSNVPAIPLWEEEVPGDNGQPRTVQVADIGNGTRAVVGEDGRATGEVVRVDPTSGEKVVEVQEDLRGQMIAPDPEGTADAGAPSSEAAVPGDMPAYVPPENTGAQQGEDQENTDDVPVVPLGAVGAAIGGLGVLERRRRHRSWQGDLNWGNGREQSLILLEGPDSPREYRYDLDVPPGGRVVENPDGSVDVYDAQGNVTKHVKAPWAYDALGREVPTYFEVDPETGELIQVVDPERTTALPILADPDKYSATKPASENPAKNPENMSKNPVTGQRSWELGDGRRVTEHPRKDGSGRTDWTVTNKEGTKQESLSQVQWDEDGSPTNLKTINNSEVDLPQQDRQDWANRTGTSKGSNIDNHPFNNGDGTFSDPTQGTTVPGYYNRELDKRSFADGNGGYITEHPNGDGTSDWTHNNTEGQQEAVASLEWKDEGGLDQAQMIDNTLVESPPETGENNQTWYNGTVTQDPYDGMLQDDQGRWHDGAKSVEGIDTPVYRMEDGTVLYGKTNNSGRTHWVREKKEGDISIVRELEWDAEGDPVVTKQDDYMTRKDYDNRKKIKGKSWGKTDAANAGKDMGNAAFFGGAEKYANYVKDSGQDAAKAIGTSVDDVAKVARIGGYATTGVGVGIGAGADIKNGMDPTEA